MIDKYQEKWLDIAQEAARQAGDYLRKGLLSSKAIEKSTRRDVKVAADRISEQIIFDYIKRHSDSAILSEESGLITKNDSDTTLQWIVDPLDGSLNYSIDIPFCCVSIGLWQEMEPLLGVVYDFNHNELFSGIIGKGSWLNGERIMVGKKKENEDAVLCTGFPVATDFSSSSLLEFAENIRKFKKVRLLGSAALSLSYVACGRADFYQENDIKIWDVAAGLAIVKASGGIIRISSSIDKDILRVQASNPILLRDNAS